LPEHLFEGLRGLDRLVVADVVLAVGLPAGGGVDVERFAASEQGDEPASDPMRSERCSAIKIIQNSEIYILLILQKQ